MDKIRKRSTISVDFLISMILIILGFAILLIFLFNIGGTGELDRTVCAQSVTFRATLPTIVENTIPLKCQTNKICITSGILSRGNCTAFKGETGINTVRVSKGAAGEEQIAQIYAQEIYDCWDMMGQGKLSLFDSGFANSVGFGSTYPTCVICTRIAFDMTHLKEANVNPDNANIQEYMMTHKVKDKNYTYFEFMGLQAGEYNTNELNNNPQDIKTITREISTSSLSTEAKGAATALLNGESSLKLTTSAIDKQINYSKDSTSVLFMQISAPGHGETTEKFIGGALSLLGVGLLFKPSAFLSVTRTIPVSPTGVAWEEFGATKVGLSSGAKAAAGYVAIAAAVLYGVQQANVYWQRSITATKCNDLVGGSEARNGCSAVRAVPYEPDMISSYCADIESIP